MSVSLVVRAPFGPYVAGDAITDPATVAAVLASHPRSVVPRKALAATPTSPAAPAATTAAAVRTPEG